MMLHAHINVTTQQKPAKQENLDNNGVVKVNMEI